MRARKLMVAGIAGATVVATMLGAGPSSAATSPASTDDAQLKDGYTVLCSDGSGDLANFSWTNGTTSATVYYNNHCAHAVNVTVSTIDVDFPTDSPWNRCLTTSAHSTGSKKFGYLFGGSIYHVSRGC
ncbi:hypothetical protein ABGB18_00685 [Nonomuraea sp. B12E4]|uniref:hypothetical protein n=1 Tax=Nonomuraea sp. B12E4 TaxID=3153564 RepID=UPI00325D3646